MAEGYIYDVNLHEQGETQTEVSMKKGEVNSNQFILQLDVCVKFKKEIS